MEMTILSLSVGVRRKDRLLLRDRGTLRSQRVA